MGLIRGSLEHIFDTDVQRRTTGFVLGRHQENIRDLIASIKANGWLDIVGLRNGLNRQPDVLKDKVVIAESFFDPLPDGELDAWEGK